MSFFLLDNNFCHNHFKENVMLKQKWFCLFSNVKAFSPNLDDVPSYVLHYWSGIWCSTWKKGGTLTLGLQDHIVLLLAVHMANTFSVRLYLHEASDFNHNVLFGLNYLFYTLFWLGLAYEVKQVCQVVITTLGKVKKLLRVIKNNACVTPELILTARNLNGNPSIYFLKI